ncbi:MAG: WhiB family transcriptional regulator [Mycobacteriales bacterium]
MTWRERAECRGETATYFFPPNHFERKDEKDLRESVARSLCRRCGVRIECLAYAVRVEERHGIWGGLNELERRRLVLRRRLQAPAGNLPHAEMGVRHRAAVGARDQADTRQLG